MGIDPARNVVDARLRVSGIDGRCGDARLECAHRWRRDCAARLVSLDSRLARPAVGQCAGGAVQAAGLRHLRVEAQ